MLLHGDVQVIEMEPCLATDLPVNLVGSGGKELSLKCEVCNFDSFDVCFDHVQELGTSINHGQVKVEASQSEHEGVGALFEGEVVFWGHQLCCCGCLLDRHCISPSNLSFPFQR